MRSSGGKRLILGAALTLLLAVGALGAHADLLKRTRHPALSPDGKTLAFSFQGDIWTVPAEGGRATRLTAHPGRDVQPIFSPDGRTLAFSSNRLGSYDIFTMPVEGGVPKRLTFNSGSEMTSSFSPDGKWILFNGSAYGASDVYKVPANGGEYIRLTWDGKEREYSANVSPDGQWIAYNHNAAPGSWRRRGYEGSNNADVWLAKFTAPVSEPKRITTNPANDFTPMFSRDGKKLYYVSDRKGQVNLWSMDLTGGEQKQLTFHQTDGARVPSYAPLAEKIAYEYDSQIYILDLKTGKTGPVKIDALADERRNPIIERSITANPSEFSVSPDGKKVALIVRGDLFVVPSGGGYTKRLVGRASRESHVAWLADSHTVVFSTDVRGQKDLHAIDITGENERALAESAEDETNPILSPDGKYLAYHQGDKAIVVIPAAGGAAVTTVKGDFADVSRSTSPQFSWSPDNKWLAFKQTGNRLEDAMYVANLADGQPKRVSRYFRDANTPHFAPNGKTLYFTGVAVDTTSLYAVDLGDEEPPTFDEDQIEKLDQPNQQPIPSGPVSVDIDFATIEDRLRRVSTGGLGEAAMTNDSRQFLVEVNGGIGLIAANAKNAGAQLIADGANNMQITRDGGRVYFMSGGQVQSLGIYQRDRRTTNFTALITVNALEENQQVFSEAWWMMDRYFYDERHNGVDWKATRAKYEGLLPFVPYKDDFYDMMAEMIQELRGSHLGVTGAPEYTADTPTTTAYLGIEPDWAVLDSQHQYKVAHVVQKSPADSKWSKINVGDYLLAVDGQDLKGDVTLDELLDRKVGRKVVLTVNSTPSKDGARQVAIKPVSQDDGDNLEYEEWVAERKKMTEKLSNGRISYVHIKGMNVPSEMRFKDEFVGEATGRDGLLVDVRYNGGGNVAHRLLDILRKKPYVVFKPRSLGKQVAMDWFGEYLWAKPAALLVNQDSASNSEMMAEGFKALGIGPVVGIPTMGAVIATGSWTFLDGGTIRTPSSGVYTASGEDMELHGRVPDVVVPYDPIAIKEGRDPQLERAVQVILSQMRVAENKK